MTLTSQCDNMFSSVAMAGSHGLSYFNEFSKVMQFFDTNIFLNKNNFYHNMLALNKTHPIFNFSRPLFCRRQKDQQGIRNRVQMYKVQN